MKLRMKTLIMVGLCVGCVGVMWGSKVKNVFAAFPGLDKAITSYLEKHEKSKNSPEQKEAKKELNLASFDLRNAIITSAKEIVKKFDEKTDYSDTFKIGLEDLEKTEATEENRIKKHLAKMFLATINLYKEALKKAPLKQTDPIDFKKKVNTDIQELLNESIKSMFAEPRAAAAAAAKAPENFAGALYEIVKSSKTGEAKTETEIKKDNTDEIFAAIGDYFGKAKKAVEKLEVKAEEKKPELGVEEKNALEIQAKAIIKQYASLADFLKIKETRPTTEKIKEKLEKKIKDEKNWSDLKKQLLWDFKVSVENVNNELSKVEPNQNTVDDEIEKVGKKLTDLPEDLAKEKISSENLLNLLQNLKADSKKNAVETILQDAEAYIKKYGTNDDFGFNKRVKEIATTKEKQEKNITDVATVIVNIGTELGKDVNFKVEEFVKNKLKEMFPEEAK